MKLQIGVPVATLDLAQATEGDQGTYLCQQNGQNYLLVAAAGHSIKAGPIPVGRKVIEAPTPSVGAEPWFITKISNEDLAQEFQTGTLGFRRNPQG